MSARDLTAEFSALWAATLREDPALAGIAHGETIRASHAAARAVTAAAAATADLPRIALGSCARGPDAPRAAAERADLVLRDVLGEGGMGRVLLATHVSLGREVAVKTLRPDARSHAASAALLHEARITGALEHPNIVPVHALGLDPAGGDPVLVMKRVEGTSWLALMADARDPAWPALLARHGDPLGAHVEVLTQVCNALEFAHARGVTHRDIKPENVMIGRYGEVYLLDWGIATRAPREPAERDAAAAAGVHLVGTPGYMAPEMVEGRADRVDERTDVYLLGATLHEVLTGRMRHAGATLEQVLLNAYLSAPADYDARAPPELAALCRDATQRDPAARPPSVSAFRARLTGYLRHRASRALSDVAGERLARLAAEAGVRAREPAALGAPDTGRALTECRFGFAQALREWPDNPAARAGLEAVLELMVERELAQSNPSGALGLLLEMRRPPAALRARIDALAARLAAARARDERVRALQREMDPAVSSAPRTAVFVAVLALSLAASTVALAHPERPDRARDAVAFIVMDALAAGALVVIGAVFRRRLFANAISRRLSWLMFALSLYVLASDVAAWRAGLTPEDTVVVRFLVLSAGFAIGAILSMPALGWLALAAGAGAVGIVLAPARATEIGTASFTVLVALTIYFVRAGRLRPRAVDTLAAD